MILQVANILTIRCSLVEMMEESAVKYLTEAIVPKTECVTKLITKTDKAQHIRRLSNVWSQNFRAEVKETQKRQRTRKFKRYALVGLATLSGGAILGLTGGLAAPLIGK